MRRILATTVLLLTTLNLSAHALLESVLPKANSTVSGPEVTLKLQFNSKIDSARSHLELLTPSKETVVLTIEKQESPGILNAHAHNLRPGAYKLHWQVLAVDGHITRGEVPFVVK